MKINIITNDNGSGLTQDYLILKRVFEGNGWAVHFHDWHLPHPPPRADVNIFLELFHLSAQNRVEWLRTADRNYIIPNQEWFFAEWMAHFKHPRFTAVLAKTRHAVEVFSPHAETIYTGFTSRDMYAPEIEKEPRFVHFAGRSSTKGTYEAVKAWHDSPGLPTLHVYHSRPWKSGERGGHLAENLARIGAAPNVKYHFGKLEDAEFARVFNSSLFHVCPSPMEGFGHYINEAMACENVLITTNAPPMNELVTKDTGFLVDYTGQCGHYMGVAYTADSSVIAYVAEVLSKLEISAWDEMRKAARAAYLEREKDFCNRITKALC